MPSPSIRHWQLFRTSETVRRQIRFEEQRRGDSDWVAAHQGAKVGIVSWTEYMADLSESHLDMEVWTEPTKQANDDINEQRRGEYEGVTTRKGSKSDDIKVERAV